MAAPTAAESMLIEERRMRAMELSVMGYTYEEISRAGIGYNPDARNARSIVAKDIQRALEARRKKRDEQALVLIEKENLKLDLMERAAWEVLRNRHYVVNQGVVVWMDPEQQPAARQRRGWANIKDLAAEIEARSAKAAPLEDDAPVLAALMVLIKIAERRAKLNGFDAPVKKILEVESGDGVDERIAGLLAKLATGGQAEIAAPPAAGGLAA